MNHRDITSEKILQMPELAHLYKAVLFLEKNKDKILFPEKYEASMLNVTLDKTDDFFNEQPNMPLKDALIAILSSYTTQLSGELLLKVTQKIIERWEKLSKEVPHSAPELELA
jgi:hypothetical protein